MCKLQYTLYPKCGCKRYSQFPCSCANYQEAHPELERYFSRETIICKRGNYDGAYDEKPLEDDFVYYGTLPKDSKDDFPWIDCDHKTYKETIANPRTQCDFDWKIEDMEQQKLSEEKAAEREKEAERQEKRDNSGFRKFKKEVKHILVATDAKYPPGHPLAGMVAPPQGRWHRFI